MQFGRLDPGFVWIWGAVVLLGAAAGWREFRALWRAQAPRAIRVLALVTMTVPAASDVGHVRRRTPSPGSVQQRRSRAGVVGDLGGGVAVPPALPAGREHWLRGIHGRTDSRS